MSRTLITGASGLLGTAVNSRLLIDGVTLPLSNANILPGTRSINLLNPDDLDLLAKEEWDAVVHCAAYRHPDFCETDKEDAHALNTSAAADIAALAADRSARMIHISTDYVFDGTTPPYSEDTEPCPVNYYGQTKLEAEQYVLGTHPSAVVLRIPALYGDPSAPLESTMLMEGIEAALSDVEIEQDNKTVRYPTFTGDVADIIAFLIKSDFSGIVQASGPEKGTRYEWSRAIAEIIGRDSSHIKSSNRDLDRKATRPINSQLSTDKLKSLGAPMPRGYSEILPSLKTIQNLINKG